MHSAPRQKTPTDPRPQRGNTHPRRPRTMPLRQHDLRTPYPSFAGTNPLGEGTAFAAAGRCLERGTWRHAGGCLVSTGSRELRPRTRCHRGSTCCCESAAVPLRQLSSERPSAQPNLRAPAGGPARRRRYPCHCGSSGTGSIWSKRLSGRLPKSPPRGIRGPGPCHCGSTAAPLRQRFLSGVAPSAPLAAAPTAESGR